VIEGQAEGATQRVSKGQGDTFTDRGGRTFRYVTPKRLGQAETSGLTVTIERGSNTIHFNVRQDGPSRSSDVTAWPDPQGIDPTTTTRIDSRFCYRK